MAGEFWNTENPDKPWGPFDPDAQLDIPFNWTEWLDGIGETIDSFTVTPEAGLEVVSSSQAGGFVIAFIRRQVGQSLQIGRKYFVRCSIVTTGVTPRKDDRTVYLKIKER